VYLEYWTTLTVQSITPTVSHRSLVYAGQANYYVLLKKESNMTRTSVAIIALAILTSSAFAQQTKVQYLDVKPLRDVVTTRLQPVKSGEVRVPLITWGGDIATILAAEEGIFKEEGIPVKLFTENDFAKQVQACINGETPFVRGTLGMVNTAAEAVKAAGGDLVVVYQMTWSNGGDTMVVRPSVKRPTDLAGKSIALQLYGPHMDYAANIVRSAGFAPRDVKFRWLKELTLPTYDTKGAVVDTMTAFQTDSKLDAAMLIIPDALTLTSQGQGGTGAEGSVKGAQILLSTKTANRIIADVYAVRRDWFDANKKKVQGFVHALLRAQESLAGLQADKSRLAARHKKIMARSGELLFDSAQAAETAEAMIADAEFVGHAGNVAFFTGQGTTRSFKTLNDEIQTAFIDLGLMKSAVNLNQANWDYATLAAGLKNIDPTKRPAFDPRKVQQRIEESIAAEPTQWEEEGTLFVVEITFEPNQSTFSADQYADSYESALKIAQTYGGAVVAIEGHSDPLGIMKARQARKPAIEIAQMEQAAKNLSLNRANAVRDSYLAFCESKGVNTDESQFVPVGVGVQSPKFNPPRTKDEWAANRRVVFRIKQVEAELSDFTPLEN
jgi:ABC-type nitrate/sulfonate/bicarbonate transport system substrate-binding protein/outer membrane protein OmpA-like peptidoglycan-associated protein